MARIVLTCWGSHGDVDPFLGLGLGLRARGHDVSIATLEYFRPVIEGAGLGFHPVRPTVDPTDGTLVERLMHPTRGSEFLLREVLFPSTEAMYEDVSAAAQGADLLVSHPITFATPVVAEHGGIPWASVVLAPTSFFSSYDYPALPPAPWLKSLQRLGHWPGRVIIAAVRQVSAAWPEPVYRLRERLGLPRGPSPLIEGQHSPRLVLALYSRVLGSPQPDWPPHVVVTGHIFHDAPHGTSLSPEVESFLQHGPAPVVFTLGSSAVLVAGRFWHESVSAVRRMGARAILLTGPERTAELQEAFYGTARGSGGSDVLVLERAPHSLLFGRSAAVVQQCGIGTLAQSLRSGRPMLAVPHAHDQPDNAWRARALGLARVIAPRKYTARRVAAALQALLSEPAYADAARRVAGIVRHEDGVAAACDALERTFLRGQR